MLEMKSNVEWGVIISEGKVRENKMEVPEYLIGKLARQIW